MSKQLPGAVHAPSGPLLSSPELHSYNIFSFFFLFAQNSSALQLLGTALTNLDRLVYEREEMLKVNC